MYQTWGLPRYLQKLIYYTVDIKKNELKKIDAPPYICIEFVVRSSIVDFISVASDLDWSQQQIHLNEKIPPINFLMTDSIPITYSHL